MHSAHNSILSHALPGRPKTGLGTPASPLKRRASYLVSINFSNDARRSRACGPARRPPCSMLLGSLRRERVWFIRPEAKLSCEERMISRIMCSVLRIPDRLAGESLLTTAGLVKSSSIPTRSAASSIRASERLCSIGQLHGKRMLRQDWGNPTRRILREGLCLRCLFSSLGYSRITIPGRSNQNARISPRAIGAGTA